MSFWTPTSLNQIVGNASSLELLRAIIGNRDRAPLTYCLEGPHGIGKNTIAKLFLQQMFPDAKIPVIQPERFGQTLGQEDLAEYPCVIWDHTERMTKEQADQLCTVLDRSTLKTTFVFLSSEYTKVPQGVRARALRVPLTKPSQSDLTGLLGSICAGLHLNFELDALSLIATRTHGVPSRAIQTLQAVSLLGDITAGTVAKLQVSVEEQAIQLLTRIATDQTPLELVSEIIGIYPAEEIIDALFTAYGTAIYDKKSVITERLNNHRRVGEIFIKWKSLSSPPPAALFILVKELQESNMADAVLAPSETAAPPIQRARPLTGPELDKLISETSRTGDT